MSPELAKLLDGPVSDRFGRPIDRCGIAYRLSGDEWLAAYSFGLDDPIAAAIWLAHLLDVCEQREWRYGAFKCHDGPMCFTVWYSSFQDVSHIAHTRLEALARAMLAVPTEDRP